jgi:hypothetical protein
MASKPFNGPVFIVGMPRSGTKLIRDLLNENQGIGIPVAESHFIPSFVAKYGISPDFRDHEKFSDFFQTLINTSFYRFMILEGRTLNQSQLIDQITDPGWSGLIELIFRFFAPEYRSQDFIFGDKTPGYVSHMPLLKTLFPAAKFVHIIRDPRDYSLSVSKTWGKSKYRAASLWVSTIMRGQRDAAEIGEDYLEIYYEELLDDPAHTVQSVCSFLGVEFTTGMTELSAPSEYLGDARGELKILNTNQQKFLNELFPSEIQRIEEITYPAMAQTNYKAVYASKYQPLSKAQMLLLNIYDGFASWRHHIRLRGIRKGTAMFYYHHRYSSWR